MIGQGNKTALPQPQDALPGRSAVMPVTNRHYVNGNPLLPPYPTGMELALFGLGCFWGAEKCFWKIPGVYTTAVGYAAGYTPNPTYQEVCSGRTGHNEVVRVVFDPNQVSFRELVTRFFEAHNPTQGMRQGNDIGSQYRSGVYFYSPAQQQTADEIKTHYQQALLAAGHAMITTEIIAAGEFYYAEDYHQQYLAKNPSGYCGLGGTGVVCAST